tara:strand:+ start:96 stop:707 length:612 start_codon:yes stop_codon:yes gene_type:complete
MQAKLEALFPTSLLRVSLPREFTPPELTFIKAGKKNTRKNHTNKYTEETNVLNFDAFRNIKGFIMSALKCYLKDILKTKEYVDIYVSESWINYTDYGESHHRHYHPNSFLSGVLYIDVLKEDFITFYNPLKTNFLFDTQENNFLNSQEWNTKINKRELIVFPSSLEHSVPTNTQKPKHTRISLSFNTFFRGNVNRNPTISLSV